MAATITDSGLILGKFLPPHEGHCALIRFARSRVARLTVVVATLAREPIAGWRRHRWLREIFADDPAIEFVHVTDENPQEPHEHPDFWEIWRASILRAARPLPEVLFTSEAYGEPLARVLGIRHEAFDPGRFQVPCSGTLCRAEPAGAWPWLPAPVRPWFVKRVAIVGPESTGKTTLAASLAREFGTLWVPEFARAFLERRNRERGNAGVCLEEDIEPIAAGQQAAEERCVLGAERLLFTDTDLLTTTIWARHYFGRCAGWIEAEARAARYDLTLLTEPDVPWVADAQRDQPHSRHEFLRVFRERLAALGRETVLIRGGWDERQATASAAVTRLLARPFVPREP